MSPAKKMCTIGGLMNIIIPMIIFAIGAVNDSGGSSFGFIFIGFAIFGAASFLYHLVLLAVYRGGIFKTTGLMLVVCLILAVNLFEMLLVKDFALWH